MKKIIFKGVGTAIVTPFKNQIFDERAFCNLIEEQILNGVDAIIVLGTTGEPSTLYDSEREVIIKTAIKAVKGRVKVIVGCGANSTDKAIKYYNQAENLNADGALIVSPYYNKATQNGIYEHYKHISRSGNLPIIVYNVPSRTGLNILPETYVKLAKLENVCGIKEASGNINQILQIFKLVKDKLAIYSGEDSLNALFSFLGADGYISVASNICPKLIKKIYILGKENQNQLANNLQFKLLPFINSLFLEVNPIPVKAGLGFLGKVKNELRLPLTKMTSGNFEILKNDLIKIMELENDCK